MSSLWVESASAAFLPLLPPGHVLPDFAPERFAAVIDSPGVQLLLAEEDGAVMGYTAFGANRDTDAPAEVGEVQTFFVRPPVWRRGVGSALMGAALEGLGELGYTGATVWSFAANARANAFYEHHGFTRDGAERREEVWAGTLEVRYRRHELA